MSNWGVVQFLAGLLHPVLNAIEGFVHDWGLAVILFTLLVRLVLFPISIRQARFAWKNRRFMNAMKDLRARFRDKPDQLKERTTQLALEHKFNPFGMIGTSILQMPIFAAVYALFYHFGSDITSSLIPWATALGQSDATHALPLFAALFTAGGVLVPIIQPDAIEQVAWLKKLTPMLMMMPLMLLVLWKAPVAISLYMSTTAAWGMIERTFLRSRFAVRRFRLNPDLVMSGAQGGVDPHEDETKKA
ncbi:YidC/Oxa1 family membrane protein insertase [Tumebacillus lipolyticus]|uniref:YidC/Oxa1 family membrane protein insertase n=1 Tax=Tumebacillus lipolyticus TaxID=1280370 RepID=A0ABW4ZU53_9BACL